MHLAPLETPALGQAGVEGRPGLGSPAPAALCSLAAAGEGGLEEASVHSRARGLQLSREPPSKALILPVFRVKIVLLGPRPLSTNKSKPQQLRALFTLASSPREPATHPPRPFLGPLGSLWPRSAAATRQLPGHLRSQGRASRAAAQVGSPGCRPPKPCAFLLTLCLLRLPRCAFLRPGTRRAKSEQTRWDSQALLCSLRQMSKPLSSLNHKMGSRYLPCRDVRNSLVLRRTGSKGGFICKAELPVFPQTDEGLAAWPCLAALQSSSCGPANGPCVCLCVCVCVRPWNATAAPLNLVGSKFGLFVLILAARVSYCVFIFLSPFRDCFPPRKV
nr:guanine nucleotide-binding protein subunit alpha-12 isoform X2 [Globicephala melas]XP_030702453.1 guanine nucleotide-binding protein subunit alpha-12 isoform X2 [Globicephala melas]